jgi:hypothetical protein
MKSIKANSKTIIANKLLNAYVKFNKLHVM